MSRGQIAMHYIRHDFNHAKALNYLQLIGMMEIEARLFLETLGAFVE